MKFYVGDIYRIVNSKSTLTALNPVYIPKSSQLSGVGIEAVTKFGFFDLDLNKKRINHKPSRFNERAETEKQE